MSASFLFESGPDGKRVAPTEFRVFPAGSFVTTKGTFVFSPRSADSVMAWHAKRKLPLMGDYEHQTDESARGGQPMIAPASITEMRPVVRQNEAGGSELWVEDVKWTDRARTMLEAGEYRFFSPTFLHDPETKEVMALLRIALTNDPAIDDLEPLVAASSAAGDGGNANADDEEEPTMGTETETQKCARCAATDAHLATVQEQAKSLSAQHQTLSAGHEQLVAQHRELLSAHEMLMKSFEDWAAEEAEEHEDATATTATAKATLCATRIRNLRALRRDFAALTGEKNSGAMLGKATAWKTGSAELATLKADADKAAKDKLAADFTALTSKLVADGKLTPAKRDGFVEQAKTRGTEHVMAFLTTAYGADSAPVVNRTETAPPSQTTTAALATLTSGEIAELAKLGGGVSVEQAAAAKAAWDATLKRNTAGAGR